MILLLYAARVSGLAAGVKTAADVAERVNAELAAAPSTPAYSLKPSKYQLPSL